MNNEEYNKIIEDFKNNMTKKEQECFLMDILDMEYSKSLRMKFIEVLTK